jgi:hypothetical protein
MATIWTAMEEASIYKNDDALPLEDKIWLSNNPARMQPPSLNPIFSQK